MAERFRRGQSLPSEAQLSDIAYFMVMGAGFLKALRANFRSPSAQSVW
jgi:hypothetical protein